MPDPALERGWVARALAEEFPDLCLRHLTVTARPGRSPRPVRRRLEQMAGRMTGGHVVHMLKDPLLWAYRVFWRQAGMDPDRQRTPVEQAALERLRSGGLRSRNLLDDALTIATLETGVPLLAFDAERVGAQIGLRLAEDHERLGGSGRPLPAGQIVVADEHRPLALLSCEVAEERAVTPRTERMTIASIKVEGVPEISVEEALWTVAETLSSGP